MFSNHRLQGRGARGAWQAALALCGAGGGLRVRALDILGKGRRRDGGRCGREPHGGSSCA
eukprot:6648465-Prymnesium_polylepis.1